MRKRQRDLQAVRAGWDLTADGPRTLVTTGNLNVPDIKRCARCLLPTLLDGTGQPVRTWCEGQVLPTFGNPGTHGERAIFVVEAESNPR